jgi:hypothetical protein
MCISIRGLLRYEVLKLFRLCDIELELERLYDGFVEEDIYCFKKKKSYDQKQKRKVKLLLL